MPDTFTPDQFSQTQPFTPASDAETSTAVQVLWREMKEADRIVEEEGDTDDGPKVQAYHAAADRFRAAPVRSLSDVLLKLQYVHEIIDIEAGAREGCIKDSVFLGLMRDLQELTSQDQRTTVPSGPSHSIPNRLQTTLSGAASEIEYLAGTITTGTSLAGTTLERLCNDIHLQCGKDSAGGVLDLINQLHFVLDSIEARAGQIIAEGNKVHKASFKLGTADRSALVS